MAQVKIGTNIFIIEIRTLRLENFGGCLRVAHLVRCYTKSTVTRLILKLTLLGSNVYLI